MNCLLTKPEFAGQVTETGFIVGPVTVEINGAVLSSLENLRDNEYLQWYRTP